MSLEVIKKIIIVFHTSGITTLSHLFLSSFLTFNNIFQPIIYRCMKINTALTQIYPIKLGKWNHGLWIIRKNTNCPKIEIKSQSKKTHIWVGISVNKINDIKKKAKEIIATFEANKSLKHIIFEKETRTKKSSLEDFQMRTKNLFITGLLFRIFRTEENHGIHGIVRIDDTMVWSYRRKYRHSGWMKKEKFRS